MSTDDSIETIRGVGPSVAEKFQRLGIACIGDLVAYYPRRYDDYSQVSKTARLKPGSSVTIRATIKQVSGRYVRRGMHITEAVASDDAGSVRIIWFNQPYRAGAIQKNSVYFISGSFELSRGRLALMNPSMELESAFPLNTARIVPIYRETKGLKSGAIRKAVAAVRPLIESLDDTLPSSVVTSADLMSRSEALLNIHFPKSSDALEHARQRLGFEELFAVTLASQLNKQQFETESGVYVAFDESLAKRFVERLPYELTGAQRRVVWQIYQDMQRSIPMNRLVEGDVGSGKTVVAAMAAMMVIKQGYQVALIAPTELLARQHADTMLELLHHENMDREMVLLVGSMKAAQKKRAQQSIADGTARLLIGTHALLSESVEMHKLGLVIIDEQHRFGVDQRKRLQAKAGHMPHVLSMTATPIPRTLALTLYGELDVSILDQLPPGRKPVITEIISPNSRKQLYGSIDAQLQQGRQMFVVCPLIEDSDVLQVLSAERVYEELSNKAFKHRRVALLHGKMKPADKDEIMAAFVAGTIDILVSTTVIEVGVNVPNATIMMIEGVERFGLAQAHQLRGRVGRGAHQGYCYLVMSDSKAPSRRLKALERSSDGFKLAEMDLEIRGPGAIYGTAQSGQLDLRLANLSDIKLISTIRAAVEDFLKSGQSLAKYPELQREVALARAVTNLN